MHWSICLIIALLAGMVAAALGFATVALVFAVLRIDPGIGGGLIALLLGMISGIGATLKTFGMLSRD